MCAYQTYILFIYIYMPAIHVTSTIYQIKVRISYIYMRVYIYMRIYIYMSTQIYT
jgi:hypothetical protein